LKTKLTLKVEALLLLVNIVELLLNVENEINKNIYRCSYTDYHIVILGNLKLLIVMYWFKKWNSVTLTVTVSVT